jgi:hypothetical protein
LSRLLWIGFAAAIAVLTWQFQEQLETMFAGRGSLAVERRADTVVLRWRGSIHAPLAAKLEEAYRDNAGGSHRFLVSLHSPGGSLQHGREVMRVIRKMQQTHAVDTVVENRRACASMCVPVYLTGQRRTAAPAARFMFHEVSFSDSVSGKVETVPKEAIGRATDQFFERYLKPFGLNERWLASMREAIRGKDVWRTAQQLVDERAGIVQALE